ncbi:MAG: DUF86 domain-containing protein, partial [Clostridia bacterium]|nr:DUF86 domain-containing protein [Clostridia bacterium]
MTERRPVDTEKVRRKIQVIRDALKKLEAIRREGPERFRANPFLEPAATRLLQVAIEALIDIANHIVAREGLGVPGTYRDALRLLVREGILDREDEPRFFAMVGFRNRAVHLYE